MRLEDERMRYLSEAMIKLKDLEDQQHILELQQA